MKTIFKSQIIVRFLALTFYDVSKEDLWLLRNNFSLFLECFSLKNFPYSLINFTLKFQFECFFAFFRIFCLLLQKKISPLAKFIFTVICILFLLSIPFVLSFIYICKALYYFQLCRKKLLARAKTEFCEKKIYKFLIYKVRLTINKTKSLSFMQLIRKKGFFFYRKLIYKFKKLRHKFKKLRRKFKKLRRKFKNLRRKFKNFSSKFRKLRHKFKNFSSKFKKLKKKEKFIHIKILDLLQEIFDNNMLKNKKSFNFSIVSGDPFTSNRLLYKIFKKNKWLNNDNVLVLADARMLNRLSKSSMFSSVNIKNINDFDLISKNEEIDLCEKSHFFAELILKKISSNYYFKSLLFKHDVLFKSLLLCFKFKLLKNKFNLENMKPSAKLVMAGKLPKRLIYIVNQKSLSLQFILAFYMLAKENDLDFYSANDEINTDKKNIMETLAYENLCLDEKTFSNFLDIRFIEDVIYSNYKVKLTTSLLIDESEIIFKNLYGKVNRIKSYYYYLKMLYFQIIRPGEMLRQELNYLKSKRIESLRSKNTPLVLFIIEGAKDSIYWKAVEPVIKNFLSEEVFIVTSRICVFHWALVNNIPSLFINNYTLNNYDYKNSYDKISGIYDFFDSLDKYKTSNTLPKNLVCNKFSKNCLINNFAFDEVEKNCVEALNVCYRANTSILFNQNKKTNSNYGLLKLLLGTLQPKSIFLSPHSSPLADLAQILAKQYDIKTITAPAVTIAAHRRSIPFNWSPDIIACYGKQCLIDFHKLGIDLNSLFLTGNISLDGLINLKQETVEYLYGLLNLNKKDKIFLIATSKIDNKEYLWINEFIKVCESRKDSKIIIKTHQSYGKESYKLVNESKICTIVENLPIYHLLKICSVIVTDYSTTGAEGILLNKPAIVVNMLKDEYPSNNYDQYGVALLIKELSEIKTVINSILDDETVKQKLALKRDEFIDNYNFKNDGKAATRIAEILCNPEEYIKQYQTRELYLMNDVEASNTETELFTK